MAAHQVRRPYQGASAEQRVATRRRQLLDAAFAALATDGAWEQLSITQLCRDAGLNKRYFYESFEALDEVAGAVLDDLVTRLLDIGGGEAAAAIADGFDTPALARRVLGRVVTWLVEDRRRATVLFATASDHPQARQHRQTAMRALAGGLAAFGVDYHGAIEPPAVVRSAAALLIGGSAEAIVQWLADDDAVDLDHLVDDLAALWVAVGDAAVERARAAQERDVRS